MDNEEPQYCCIVTKNTPSHRDDNGYITWSIPYAYPVYAASIAELYNNLAKEYVDFIIESENTIEHSKKVGYFDLFDISDYTMEFSQIVLVQEEFDMEKLKKCQYYQDIGKKREEEQIKRKKREEEEKKRMEAIRKKDEEAREKREYERLCKKFAKT